MENRNLGRKRQFTLIDVMGQNGANKSTGMAEVLGQEQPAVKRRMMNETTKIPSPPSVEESPPQPPKTTEAESPRGLSYLHKYRKYLGQKAFAERMRPNDINESVQGPSPKDKAERIISGNLIQSVIVWGTTGTGKTTWSRILARRLSKMLNCKLQSIPGPLLSTKDISGPNPMRNRRVLLCDEIHRLSKVQQDALLGPVESGEIVLIGVTTENPYAVLNKALCSRCQVLKMSTDREDGFQVILDSIFNRLGEHLGLRICIENSAVALIKRVYGTDLRSSLNMLENDIVHKLIELDENPSKGRDMKDVTTEVNVPVIAITESDIKSKELDAGIQNDTNDRYDLISAYQKSMRGSDRDAAIYYLARLLEGGTDPMYVARRLLITASEDCDCPMTFNAAASALQATQQCGMPECRLPLAYVTNLVCRAPKSCASHDAYGRAAALIKAHPHAKVPAPISNSGPSRGLYMKPNQSKTMAATESREYYKLTSYLPPEVQRAVIFEDTG